MQAYPAYPSFLAGQAFGLCVEPGKRFSFAVYHPGPMALERESCTVAGFGPGIQKVKTPTGNTFESDPTMGGKTYDEDWEWPELSLRSDPALGSRVVVAIAFEVDAIGKALDPIGRKIEGGGRITLSPPDSDSMALLVAVPAQSAGNQIAYILPLATYHAYNGNGGGCFYGYEQPKIQQADLVTLHRPGGGLGAKLGEPPDPYDTQSPRQQFAHWDLRFLQFMQRHGHPFDVFCDLDLDRRGPRFDMNEYKLIVSAGHHEYWSQPMRDNLRAFLANGGNYACFSGNTCYRPVSFDYGVPRIKPWLSMKKLGITWPKNNEDSLIGLSYAFGGGRWGDWSKTKKEWVDCGREPYGYIVKDSSHWVFAGTGLTNETNFGKGDYLVGYEADGLRPDPNNPFKVLAVSDLLVGFQDPGASERRAAFGLFGTDGALPEKRGLVFNAGTTDWARVLTTGEARWREAVEKITENVLGTLSHRT